MSWRYSDIVFRPIDRWPGQRTPDRRMAPFTASWGATIALLEHELRQLDARNVVIQIAIDERDIRIDGQPKARAHAAHPGVILALESQWGPLKFAVDRFAAWQDNLRAIALAMEALRKVDRYGVTRRGEQYTGWRAIPASTDAADQIQTLEQAAALIDSYGGLSAALKATHPDRGGDPDVFRKVLRAKELLA